MSAQEFWLMKARVRPVRSGVYLNRIPRHGTGRAVTTAASLSPVLLVTIA